MPMIDQEWLEHLDFVSADGLHIKGLAGIGSENIVLKAIDPNGKELVIQSYRCQLAYHINEIPLNLSGKPLYDLNRVNRKVAQLIGDKTLDSMTSQYDRLFSSVIRILYQSCTQNEESKQNISMVVSALSRLLTPSVPEALPFLLGTPMMTRRLEELATLSPDPADPLSQWVRVNGPNFTIEGLADGIKDWATSMLAFCESNLSLAPFEPATLSENPLFTWGSPVTDYFFTDQELPAVVAFIEKQFGRLPSHPRVMQFLEQITAISTLMACTLKESRVSRLVQLCGQLGFMFDVLDRDGKVVASSLRRPGNQ
jgi:hypothetical protein